MKIRSNKSPDEFHGNLQCIMAGIGMYMLIGFSATSPLPGGTCLAALKVHDLRNALKISKRRGIVKKYGKKGSDGSEGRIGRVLNGFMSLSTLQT